MKRRFVKGEITESTFLELKKDFEKELKTLRTKYYNSIISETEKKTKEPTSGTEKPKSKDIVWEDDNVITYKIKKDDEEEDDDLITYKIDSDLKNTITEDRTFEEPEKEKIVGEELTVTIEDVKENTL